MCREYTKPNMLMQTCTCELHTTADVLTQNCECEQVMFADGHQRTMWHLHPATRHKVWAYVVCCRPPRWLIQCYACLSFVARCARLRAMTGRRIARLYCVCAMALGDNYEELSMFVLAITVTKHRCCMQTCPGLPCLPYIVLQMHTTQECEEA